MWSFCVYLCWFLVVGSYFVWDWLRWFEGALWVCFFALIVLRFVWAFVLCLVILLFDYFNLFVCCLSTDLVDSLFMDLVFCFAGLFCVVLCFGCLWRFDFGVCLRFVCLVNWSMLDFDEWIVVWCLTVYICVIVLCDWFTYRFDIGCCLGLIFDSFLIDE